jgi:hypothetical protein
VTVICQALGLLFAFVVLAPYAPVTYDYPQAAHTRSAP